MIEVRFRAIRHPETEIQATRSPPGTIPPDPGRTWPATETGALATGTPNGDTPPS